MLSSPEKVTVLIPVYNRATYLFEALNCLYNQTYKNLEVIVYDDGSTDDTPKICSQPRQLTFIRDKVNKGVAHARNVLLKECKTKYACWWDSDDLSNTHRIAKQMEKIKAGFDIVFTSFKSFRVYESVNYREVPVQKERPIAFASMLFKINPDIQFNEKKRFGGEDIEWSNRMKKGKAVAHVAEVLYYVRYHNRRIGRVRARLTNQDRSGSYAAAEKRIFGSQS